MGASAGADMANILGLTYPDVFRASAMFAGCAYARCSDVLGNQALKESRRIGRRPGPAIIFQGSGDMLNNLALGKTLLQQQIGMRRITQPSSVEHHGDIKAVNPGSGNPCIGPHGNWPCAAGVTGWTSYPYLIKRYAKAGRTVVEWWVIHGMNHDYPNGDYGSTFTDPAGPDITSAAWRFFSSA
jgi:poly(3-hydroxybutyrate) depolymerase